MCDIAHMSHATLIMDTSTAVASAHQRLALSTWQAPSHRACKLSVGDPITQLLGPRPLPGAHSEHLLHALAWEDCCWNEYFKHWEGEKDIYATCLTQAYPIHAEWLLTCLKADFKSCNLLETQVGGGRGQSFMREGHPSFEQGSRCQLKDGSEVGGTHRREGTFLRKDTHAVCQS